MNHIGQNIMEQKYLKKTEKIGLAIYLVSNHLKDNEPMKWELRKEVFSFLESICSIGNEYDKEIFFSCSRNIISMLHISSSSGLISKANADMIINEIEFILSSTKKDSLEDNIKAGFVLSEDFFATDHDSILNTDKAHIKNRLSNNIANNKDINKNNVIKDKKNSRQSRIISLLKNQSDLTIKDFVKVINDCSEKTIQRELLSLVEKGIIKKEGERRWSKYSLK